MIVHAIIAAKEYEENAKQKLRWELWSNVR